MDATKISWVQPWHFSAASTPDFQLLFDSSWIRYCFYLRAPRIEYSQNRTHCLSLCVPCLSTDSTLLSRWPWLLPSHLVVMRGRIPLTSVGLVCSAQLFRLKATVHFRCSVLLSNVIKASQQAFGVSPECSYLMNHSRTLHLSGVFPLPCRKSRIPGLAPAAVRGLRCLSHGLCLAMLVPLPCRSCFPGLGLWEGARGFCENLV